MGFVLCFLGGNLDYFEGSSPLFYILRVVFVGRDCCLHSILIVMEKLARKPCTVCDDGVERSSSSSSINWCLVKLLLLGDQHGLRFLYPCFLIMSSE